MSERQLSLTPERSHQDRAALHGAEAVARAGLQISVVRGAAVGEFVVLEMTPDVLVRIEFGRELTRNSWSSFVFPKMPEQRFMAEEITRAIALLNGNELPVVHNHCATRSQNAAGRAPVWPFASPSRSAFNKSDRKSAPRSREPSVNPSSPRSLAQSSTTASLPPMCMPSSLPRQNS